jgi:aldose 1-epimerase
MATRQTPTPFGEHAGEVASLFTLENETIRARITNYGGILVSLEAPDCEGRRGDVVLGFASVADYAATRGSFGAILGRNANRIAGAEITIDGRVYRLSDNENGATLHGGAVGFSKRFWRVAAAAPQELVLTLTSTDGDQGFPGEVQASARYRLAGTALELHFEARTTKPTPLSLSAHPYFNLDGPGAGNCLDHRVQIVAPMFLPTDRRQIPTGERRAVAGTPFDFTAPQPIGLRIREPNPQLRYGRGYDHYFVLPEDGAGTLRLAARAYGGRSGRVLEVLTTQRGVQFYSGNNLDGSAPGRAGLYRQSAGFAFEPQGFPNAANQPDFPSTLLRPGTVYRESIVYRFRTAGEAGDI